MVQDRIPVSVRELRVARRALMTGVSLALFGCGGDTLYDTVAPGVEPPEVAIVSPSTGSQVLASQRVPISVSAQDAEGISSITVRVTGQATQTIVFSFTPPRVSVTADTAIVVPEGASGNIQINASALNSKGVEGQSTPVTLSVSNMDGLAPAVSLSVETAPRMELTDEIRVTVRGVDNPGGSGVAETSLTAIVRNTARSDTLVLTRTDTRGVPSSDTVTSVFTFTPPFVDALNLPDTLHILFFGMAVDDDGNCGGAVSAAFTDEVACSTVTVGGTSYDVANAPTEPEEIIAVSGRTSLAPGGGILADLLVDTIRSRVYVSNLSNNRINTLEADPGTWGPDIWVGAEPWGLAITPDADTLFVANSGGTSISYVSLTGTPREDLGRRYVTQNNPLFEVAEEEGKVVGYFYDYSDRPQFIAQDVLGRLLFSTKPTAAASLGSVRVVRKEAGWASPETQLLLFGEDLVADDQTTAIAHADSINLHDTALEIFDHKPGFPDVVVRSGVLPLDQALTAMANHRAAGNSDILIAQGWKWEIQELALHDTTFVATSGDRRWVAFGEGGAAAGYEGRILLWDATTGRLHRRLLVRDLVNNAAERVTGLDMNRDGTLGSASGVDASYYWTTDLRLQGLVTKDPAEGAGAVLHPDHPTYAQGLTSSERTLSFVGQGDFTVRILDTVHFTQRGEIHIRDNIAGPLKAAPPLPTDNAGQGRSCSGADCVVLKLYGITDAGGVVVIDVRRRDIAPLN
jgi:hypothetical protein